MYQTANPGFKIQPVAVYTKKLHLDAFLAGCRGYPYLILQTIV